MKTKNSGASNPIFLARKILKMRFFAYVVLISLVTLSTAPWTEAGLFKRDPRKQLQKLVEKKGWVEVCRSIAEDGRHAALVGKLPELNLVCKPILHFGGAQVAFVGVCQYARAPKTLDHLFQMVGGYHLSTIRAAAVRASQFGRIEVLEYFRSLPNLKMVMLTPAILQSAAVAGRLDVVTYVSRNRLPVPLAFVQRAFVLAAENGHLDVVNFMLRAPLTPQIREQALELAAAKGHVDIVRRLFSLSTDQSTLDPNRILVNVARYGITDVLAELLKGGGYRTADSKLGGDALLAAVRHGQAETLRLLLEHGANVHYEGDQAVILAAQQGNVETVRVLLGYGVNVNALSGAALQHAVVRGHRECVEVLLREGGASVEKSGDGPLAIAERKGYDDIVALLLEHSHSPALSVDRDDAGPTTSTVAPTTATTAATTRVRFNQEVEQYRIPVVKHRSGSGGGGGSVRRPLFPSVAPKSALSSRGTHQRRSEEPATELPSTPPLDEEATETTAATSKLDPKVVLAREQQQQQQEQQEQQEQPEDDDAAGDGHDDDDDDFSLYPPPVVVAVHTSDSAQSYETALSAHSHSHSHAHAHDHDHAASAAAQPRYDVSPVGTTTQPVILSRPYLLSLQQQQQQLQLEQVEQVEQQQQQQQQQQLQQQQQQQQRAPTATAVARPPEGVIFHRMAQRT